MLASVALEHSGVVFVVDSAGSVVVDYEVDSGVVCVVQDSKGRAQVVISLKTYTRITLAPTSRRRPVGYEWMVILVLPPGLLLSTPPVGMEAAGSMQSPVNR
jgi:hypothetical protein